MTKPFDPASVSEALKTLRALAMPDEASVRGLRSNSRALKKLLGDMHATQDHLLRLERAIDAILVPDHVFDLTKPETVAEVVVYKMEQQGKEPLASIQPFYGSGVYALYYHDGLSAYEAITRSECPIYVGSAGPETSNAPSAKLQGTKLFDRIMEHLKKSISQSRNLKAEEFCCRYLVVQSGLEKAAEDFLIRRYSPVWNKESKVCSGIGKHGDVARRELSDWDVLHGGREWAGTQTSRSGKTPAVVEGNIVAHFRRLLSEDRAKWEHIFNPAWVAKQQK
jgi:hypothetical protein